MIFSISYYICIILFDIEEKVDYRVVYTRMNKGFVWEREKQKTPSDYFV